LFLINTNSFEGKTNLTAAAECRGTQHDSSDRRLLKKDSLTVLSCAIAAGLVNATRQLRRKRSRKFGKLCENGLSQGI
jgi:hypothetical protein